MKPTRNVVSFIFEKKDNVSSGGIVLQGKSSEATFGVVQAIGPMVKDVAVGDIILGDWSKAHAVATDLLAIEEDHIHLILDDM